MVEFVEVVNGSAVAGQGCNGLLDHVLRFRQGNIAGFFRLLKNTLGLLHNAVVLFDKSIAAVKNTRSRLIIAAQFVFVLDIDNGNIQKGQAREMCLRQ